MNRLILFHQSIDSLDDAEYDQFLHGMGRTVITTILFHGLKHQMVNSKHSHIRKMNVLIRTIKQARIKDKSITNKAPEIPPIAITLNDIPDVIVSEISSFLFFFESIQFAKTNRSIFIGSRSVTLPRYSLSPQQFAQFTNYCNQHWNQSQHLCNQRLFKSLAIQCSNHGRYDDDFALKHNCNRFHQLYHDIQHLMLIADETTPLDIITQHLFETNKLCNVKSLTLHYRVVWFYIKDKRLMPLDILRQISNLKTFELVVREDADADHDFRYGNQTYEWHDIDECLSQLKGFAVSTFMAELFVLNRLTDVIHRSLTNKLESFHNGYTDITEALNGKLDGLKELCLHLNDAHMDDVTTGVAILLQQNWSNLQRIYLKLRHENYLTSLLLDKLVRNVEYIAFNITDQAQNSYSVLDHLLNSLEKVHKETFKVRWERMWFGRSDDVYLDRMVRMLNSNCTDWMVIGYHWKFTSQSTDILDGFKSKYNVVYNTTGTYCDFVISNMQCRINGYHEQWIMTCKCCKQHPLFM